MGTLRAIFVCLALVGCGHSQHGLRVYTPVAGVDGQGNPTGRTALLLSANADMPGVKRIATPEVEIDFDTTVQGQTSTVLLNRKGEVIGTNTAPVVAGLFTSEVTRAQGEADKSRIKEVSAGVTGAALSLVAPAIAGGSAGTITGAVK